MRAAAVVAALVVLLSFICVSDAVIFVKSGGSYVQLSYSNIGQLDANIYVKGVKVINTTTNLDSIFSISNIYGQDSSGNYRSFVWAISGEYISIGITNVPNDYATYKIVINGNSVEVYNTSDGLEASAQVSGFWEKVSQSGKDIRVFDQNARLLYFWIEKFDYVNQTAVIWVNLTVGITELNIAYGNSYATGSVYEKGERVFDFFDDANNALEYHFDKGYVSGGMTVLDDGTILVAIYDYNQAKLYKSTDNGQTWTEITSPWTAEDHIRITSYGQSVFTTAHSSGYIYFKKSTDGGATWSTAVTIDSGCSPDSAVYAVDENTLYIATLSSDKLTMKIWKSTDGGATWTQVGSFTDTVTMEDQKIRVLSNGNLIVTFEREWEEGGHSGIYCRISTDGGVTWSDLITIYDDGVSDNDGGDILELPDGTLYYYFSTNEDGGSTYQDMVIKRVESQDGGYTWGNKVVAYPVKDAVELTVVRQSDGKIRLLGMRQYVAGTSLDYEYPFTVVLDDFVQRWNSDSGSAYYIEYDGRKAIAVESKPDNAVRGFATPLTQISVSDYIVEWYGHTIGTDWDNRLAFRWQDTDNHYMVIIYDHTNLGDTTIGAKGFIRQTGTYTQLAYNEFIPSKEWQHFKLIVQGNTFTLYMGGSQILQFSDSAFSTGGIALASAKESTCYIALFSDIRVYKLDDFADFGTPVTKMF